MNEVELRFVFKHRHYLGNVCLISGAGKETMHDLMVGNRFFGQLWKIEGEWRYGGCLDEIGLSLCEVMRQIEHAKFIQLPEALYEISIKYDLLEIDHDLLADWWQERGWLFYPTLRGDVVDHIRNLQRFTKVKMREDKTFFIIHFEINLNKLPLWN